MLLSGLHARTGIMKYDLKMYLLSIHSKDNIHSLNKPSNMGFFLLFPFLPFSLTIKPLKSDLTFPMTFISLQVTILPWFFPDPVHLPPCPQIHFSKA